MAQWRAFFKCLLVCLFCKTVAIECFVSNLARYSKVLQAGSSRATVFRQFQTRRELSRLRMMGAPPKLEGEVFGKDRLLQEEADIVKMEKQGMGKKEVTLTDIISLWVTNIVLTYGDKEKYANLQDGAVVSEGVIDDLVGGPLFLPLYKYFKECGGFYKFVNHLFIHFISFLLSLEWRQVMLRAESIHGCV